EREGDEREVAHPEPGAEDPVDVERELTAGTGEHTADIDTAEDTELVPPVVRETQPETEVARLPRRTPGAHEPDIVRRRIGEVESERGLHPRRGEERRIPSDLSRGLTSGGEYGAERHYQCILLHLRLQRYV